MRCAPLALLAVAVLVSPAQPDADARRPRPERVLQVHLLAGQSNMTGYAHSFLEGDLHLESLGDVDAVSLEYLVTNPTYLAGLDPGVYSMIGDGAFGPSWFDSRQADGWGVHLEAATGGVVPCRATQSTDPAGWVAGPHTMGLGFGYDLNVWSRFGPELGIGRALEAETADPYFLFKCDQPGTELDLGWRPPGATGSTGVLYTNTIASIQTFLAGLDADLADDGRLNAYGDATGYRVASFVWFQGTSDRGDGLANLVNYRDLLVTLVQDIRADLGVPKLPVIVVEHPQVDRAVDLDGALSGADGTISQAKLDAIELLNQSLPGHAHFVPTDDLLSTPLLFDPFHFEKRAENVLEIGWRIGRALLDNGHAKGPSPFARPASRR